MSWLSSKQVGGERVPAGVARGGLGDSGAADRILHCPLKDGFVEVVTAMLAGDAVHVDARGREDPLPSPGSARVRVLAEERAGQLDPAGAVPKVVFVLPAHPLEVREQVCLHRGRQHGGAIVVPLAVADGELVRRDIDVLRAQATALEQPQSGAVPQDRHEPRHSVEALEDGADLLARQEDGQMQGPLGPDDRVEPGQVDAEHLTVEKEQGAQGLVLGGGGDLPLHGEVRNAATSATPFSAG